MKGYPKFKALLVERGIKQKDIAKLLGITAATFNAKINGNGDFTVTAVKKMCMALDIDAAIFFGVYVPKSEQNESEAV